jgi:hypothetical protein
MVRRVLALLGAVGMVVASLVIRDRLERNQEERAQTLRLICAPELETTCRSVADGAEPGRLSLTVEAPGTTADRLAAATGDPGLDGWLVPEPWPDVVDIRRRTKALEPLFDSDRRPLARSPLVLVVWKDRAAVLASRCNGPVTWKCLGEAAAAGPWTASGGRPEWGSLKPGHGTPEEGVGLLVLGQAVAGWFGRTDLSTIDLEDDGFSRWFSALERAVPASTSPPLDLMLSGAGRAVYDAVGTVEAQASPLLARAARRTEVDLLYPSPMSTADVVLATVRSGSAGSSLRRVAGGDEARQALAANGWRVQGLARAEGVTDSPPLPPSTGLAPPGLLDALRNRWHEVTGR